MIYNMIAGLLLLGGATGIVASEVTDLGAIKDFGVVNYIALISVGALLYIIRLMSNYFIKKADKSEETVSQMAKEFSDTIKEIIMKCNK